MRVRLHVLYADLENQRKDFLQIKVPTSRTTGLILGVFVFHLEAFFFMLN